MGGWLSGWWVKREAQFRWRRVGVHVNTEPTRPATAVLISGASGALVGGGSNGLFPAAHWLPSTVNKARRRGQTLSCNLSPAVYTPWAVGGVASLLVAYWSPLLVPTGGGRKQHQYIFYIYEERGGNRASRARVFTLPRRLLRVCCRV